MPIGSYPFESYLFSGIGFFVGASEPSGSPRPVACVHTLSMLGPYMIQQCFF
ncbi:protein of unknown function [Candidatus Methylomirabilis oxygeniifera]|uniref:Uncharacterized protein n=1 Tax=Methylomirabilis oxygeniifera TaxID=671143 RepID=D5MJ16_METO1|nr:protein of unknown function [Candidatus Methylomirabilis oxyfera]